MQYYDINVPANSTQRVAAQGTFLYYLSGSAGGSDSTLKVRAGFGGTTVLLKPGQSIQLPAGEVKGDTWILENYANAATILGVVLVGEGDFSDNRISGSVEVIDGGKARTLAGNAFGGFAYQANVAAQYTRIQLWNPAASAKNINLENLIGLATVTGAAVGHIRIINTALGTLSGTGNSKKSGGAASVMELRTDTTATVSPNNAALASLSIPVSQMQPYKPVEPLVIGPGYGVVFWGTAGNIDFGATFEWYEEGV